MVKICPKCHIKFIDKNSGIQKFCSKSCNASFLMNNLKYRDVLSKNRMSSKNPNWKRNVGIQGLHQWIKSKLKKPSFCSMCNISKPYDLANISSTYDLTTYNRNLNNWEWLCRKCHMTKDGRLEKFLSFNKNRRREIKLCKKLQHLVTAP